MTQPRVPIDARVSVLSHKQTSSWQTLLDDNISTDFMNPYGHKRSIKGHSYPAIFSLLPNQPYNALFTQS